MLKYIIIFIFVYVNLEKYFEKVRIFKIINVRKIAIMAGHFKRKTLIKKKGITKIVNNILTKEPNLSNFKSLFIYLYI